MNSYTYYNRSQTPWTPVEDAEIKHEYETEEHSILQIGDKHQRTPGCVAYRLKKLEVIPSHMVARGYTEYKASDLFKEIIEASQRRDQERIQRKMEKERAQEENLQTGVKSTRTPEELRGVTTVPRYQDAETRPRRARVISEIDSIKAELAELKRDIKQVLHYMTSLYEFETSS